MKAALSSIKAESQRAGIRRLGWLLVSAVLFAGCASLRPVVDEARYYVLSPMARQPTGTPMFEGALGLARIEIPDYLMPKPIASRRGDGEIHYAENLRWAERLDKGIERVLAANLACFLKPSNSVLSAWRRSEVCAELYVSIQRFEADETGRVTLETRWRVTSPGAAKILRASTSTIVRPGPPPGGHHADAVVRTMSEALTDLSQEMATALAGSRDWPP